MNIDEIFKELAEYTMMKEEAENRIESLKADIKSYMAANDTDTVIGSEHKATYKKVVSNRFNSTAFKNEHAELYKEYVKPVTSTRFTFN